MAPKGAVIRMERTARVRISSPIGCHSVRPYLMALSRKIGPRAAWTVALGIQAKAMKIFSLVLRLPQVTAKKVPTMRMARAPEENNNSKADLGRVDLVHLDLGSYQGK